MILVKRSDLLPAAHWEEIDEVDRWYSPMSTTASTGGFAGTQAAYEQAYHRLLDRLDWLSDRLADQRYLVGDTIAEADVRLFTTPVRFDPTTDTSRATAEADRDAHPVGLRPRPVPDDRFGDTVDFDHIKRHCYQVHRDFNSTGIVPPGPGLTGWLTLHGRESVGSPVGIGTPPPPRPHETVPAEHTRSPPEPLGCVAQLPAGRGHERPAAEVRGGVGADRSVKRVPSAVGGWIAHPGRPLLPGES